jgi:hypothetical protein
MNKVYNKNSIYLMARGCTADQARATVHEIMTSKEMVDILGHECKYQLVLVESQGQFQDHGYIFVESEKAYNVLLNRNPDGSERVYTIEDPNFVPTNTINWDEEKERLNKIWGKNFDKEVPSSSPIIDLDWEKEAISSIPPVLYIHLPPLITIPVVKTENGDELRIRLEPAYVMEKYVVHTLKAMKVPKEVTKELIQRHLSFFSSDPKWPKVNINSDGNAVVHFKESTPDASFAALMLYNYRFVVKGKEYFVSFRVPRTKTV